MNNAKINLIIPAIIIALGLAISYSVMVSAQESSVSQIVYPVAELGNCANESACKSFCDDQNNISACVVFAEKHNLISKNEAAKAKAFIKAGKVGPGNCRGKNECESFCNDPENMDVCLSFAKNNGLMDENEIREAEKFAKVLKEGVKVPGNCRGKNECENYCNNPDNMEECLAFAEKAKIIPKQELEEAKKAMKAMKSGIKPPGNCRGKKECEAYCGTPEHMEECFAFAEKAGFIPPEEAEQARKMMPLMKAGKMPGGCRGKDECESYCADESHMDECTNFAMEAGLMKPEEAEMFKKTGGKGPGGCKGKEQCESFCNNPQNQEVCFGFAKEHNLIPLEEIEKMKGGMEQMRKMMGGENGPMMSGISDEPGRDAGMPPEIAQCLKSTVGEEVMDKMKSGQMMPSQQLGEQMRKCFEQFVPRGGPQGGQNGQMPPAGIMPEKFRGESDNNQMPSKEIMEKMMEEGKIPQAIQDIYQKMPPGTIRDFEVNSTPNKEFMEKMMQERKIPEGVNMQNIPEQYKNMIPQGIIPQEQNKFMPMPLDNKMPLPTDESQFQKEPAPYSYPVQP